MRITKSFTDILALRGRIVIFTNSAPVGLRFEQHAERHHATVITTRGWADAYGPLGAWQRIHTQRDYGVLSCDQQRYVKPEFYLPATDIVWVGDIGDPLHVAHKWAAFQQAMDRGGSDTRHWLCAEDAL